jgi:hypothetical protein
MLPPITKQIDRQTWEETTRALIESFVKDNPFHFSGDHDERLLNSFMDRSYRYFDIVVRRCSSNGSKTST